MVILTSQEEFDKTKSRGNIKLQCQKCSKSFLLPKNRVLAGLNGNKANCNQFCSVKCRHKAQIKRKKLKCQNCNQTIFKTLTEFNKSKNHFCSYSCSATYHNKLKRKPKPVKFKPIIQILLNCCQCQKQISRLKSQLKKSKSGKFFCSKSCRLKYSNKHWIKHSPKSYAEEYLFQLLKSDFPSLDIKQNDRTILPDGLEIDIYIFDIKLCIELNGPFHYYPIFGIEKLKNTKDRDIKKQKSINKLGLDSIIINISNLNGKQKTESFLNTYYFSSLKPLIENLWCQREKSNL